MELNIQGYQFRFNNEQLEELIQKGYLHQVDGEIMPNIEQPTVSLSDEEVELIHQEWDQASWKSENKDFLGFSYRPKIRGPKEYKSKEDWVSAMLKDKSDTHIKHVGIQPQPSQPHKPRKGSKSHLEDEKINKEVLSVVNPIQWFKVIDAKSFSSFDSFYKYRRDQILEDKRKEVLEEKKQKWLKDMEPYRVKPSAQISNGFEQRDNLKKELEEMIGKQLDGIAASDGEEIAFISSDGSVIKGECSEDVASQLIN